MSHRILVVDDEASIRSLLEDFFEEHGFQVAAAGDADEAEHILGRRRCHLAIIDFLLPRRNGFAVAEAIRHHPDRASTPIILISGVFKNPKTAVEAREKYGVEAFLSKPLDLDRLLDTVRQALAGIPADAEADAPPPVVSRSMDVVPPAPRAAGAHSVERAGDVPPPRGLSYGPREGRGRSGPSAAVRASPLSPSSPSSPSSPMPRPVPSPPNPSGVPEPSAPSNPSGPSGPSRSSAPSHPGADSDRPEPSSPLAPGRLPSRAPSAAEGRIENDRWAGRPFPVLDEQGDLARFPLAMLLSAISFERGTGMLDLTHDATHRRIYLIEGRPTFMQSNYEGENVGALLLRRGRVTEPDFDRCLRYMKEEGRTLQQSLLDLRLVTEPDLATAYKLLAGQLLPSALGMARGRYRWRETDAFVGRVPEGNFDPMSLLFDGIKRFVHPPQIFSFFKGREDYPILPSELFERLLPYFRKAFSADNIAALIDGSATYRRISRDHANDAATVVPQLFALVTSGMAVVPEPDSNVDMMAAVEAAAQSAGQEQAWLSDSGGKLDVSSGRENMARAIDRYYEEIMASDFFQVIGVGRGSSTEEIKTRYFELARKWNPDFYDDAELGPRRQVLGEVFGRITEAYETLTDRVRREEYVLFLDRKAKGLPTDVAEISRAEQLFDQADAMMKRGDWPKACEVLAEAIKGSPEPTYFAALGWATFNLDPSRQANVTRAVQLLKRALSMQQNLPIAHQYMGRVCHARGQTTEARKWWKRCLELEPHNAEAIRGLRALSKAGVPSGGDEPSKNGLLDRFLQKK